MSQPKITRKRSKLEEIVDGEDRISALPDCLLVEIISRLPTTETAIKTGTLSKRWKYLWNSVHTLNFQYYLRLPFSEFVSSVDKTLIQCRRLKLRKFEVKSWYDVRFESQFKNWIRYAVSCEVEKLDLSFYDSPLESNLLNDDFYFNSYFTDLKLSYGLFNPKGAITWKSLRSLYISIHELDLNVIETIVSGCALLETLDIREEYGGWQLAITSNEIKKFVFSNCMELYDDFETRVNNVIRYAISSNVEVLDLDFRAEDDDEYEAEFLLNEYFFNNSCFTNLRLGGCIFDPEGTISWKKLKSLCILNGNLDEDTIENILSGSPLLETLELEDCYGHKRLDINSKSVKKLVFSRYHDRNLELEIANVINAPNILSLTIKGSLYLLKLLPSTMSSLVEVNLDFTMYEIPYDDPRLTEEIKLVEEEMFEGFIRNFCQVEELKIGNYYGKDTCKQAILEKYRWAMLKEYQNTMICSKSEEVRQLKEKNKKMEHEQAEREAKSVMRETEKEAKLVMQKVELE